MNDEILDYLTRLDTLAEKAGGYVLNVNELNTNKDSSEEFTALRKYCIANKKRYQELNANDFKQIGIHYKNTIVTEDVKNNERDHKK